jgi:hypothetical protein
MNSSRSSEGHAPAEMRGDGTLALPCVEVVSDDDNQWFGDVMILQVLADSPDINEQEREVLNRWIKQSAEGRAE